MTSLIWKKLNIDEYKRECDQAGEESVCLVDDMETAKSASSPGACTSLLRTTACLLGAVIFLFMVMLMFFQLAFRRPLFNGEEMRKSWVKFSGIDDVSYEQEVTVSSSGDYVMYHVKQPDEETWIFDNYNQGYRLMKLTSAFEQICYVTPLNSTRSELGNIALLKEQVVGEGGAIANRKKRQTTYYVDETREIVWSQLDETAMELCVDTPSYWIHPTTAFSRSHEEFARTHGRDKRNVKKCVVSCCVMVCCCNQKWLQWQTTTTFNCHNVCHGCTSKADMDRTEVC